MKAALDVKGRKISTMAREIEMTTSTLHGWISGRMIVPDRKRGRLEAVMGTRIDWAAYAEEFAAAGKAKGASASARARPLGPDHPAQARPGPAGSASARASASARPGPAGSASARASAGPLGAPDPG